MITFRQREITPAESFVTVRLGSGSDAASIPYQANFDYVVKTAEGSWVEAVPDPETGVLTFTPQENTGELVRECEVTVSPKDNPDYVCTTFRVIQATKYFTATLEEGGPFTFDSEGKILYAPAEGGDAVLWLTFPASLTATIPDTDWLSAEMADVDGFRWLKVHVDPAEEAAGRESAVIIRLQVGSATIGIIKVVQAGAVSGD